MSCVSFGRTFAIAFIFRARFNTTGYFASPLLPSSLADLLNEELAARRPDVTELRVSQE